MQQRYTISSIQTSKNVRRVIFSRYDTHCFRFGFRIQKLKSGVKINLISMPNYTSKVEILMGFYPTLIKELKAKKFGTDCTNYITESCQTLCDGCKK